MAISVGIALWYCASLFFGDAIAIVRWANYAAPWIGLAALFAALPACFARDWRTATPQLLLALLILWPLTGRFWPGRLWDRAAPGDLRVVTFNITDFRDETRARTYARAAASIAALRPDLVFLQQIGDKPLLLAAFGHESALRGLQVYAPARADGLILSRFPLSHGSAPFDRALHAEVPIGHCVIGLWDVHGPHGEHDVKTQASFFRNVASQAKDIDALIAGDMNSTEFNSVQAPVRESFSDAFARRGFGSGFTFPTRVRRLGLLGPLVRIDQIFYRAPLEATEAHTFGNRDGSDHLGLFAAFHLAPACATGSTAR